MTPGFALQAALGLICWAANLAGYRSKQEFLRARDGVIGSVARFLRAAEQRPQQLQRPLHQDNLSRGNHRSLATAPIQAAQLIRQRQSHFAVVADRSQQVIEMPPAR
jgi:hypothetical protein